MSGLGQTIYDNGKQEGEKLGITNFLAQLLDSGLFSPEQAEQTKQLAQEVMDSLAGEQN